MARTKKEKSIDGPSKSKGNNNLSLKEEEFVVHHIDEEEADIRGTVVDKMPTVAEKVTVKFGNFVNLVANHDYDSILDKNSNEEVIMSSDLLADLANAHEQGEEKRIPAIFIIGVVLGIVITYILLTFD
ncbi:hypothetical protein ACFL3T_03035 [Patescibacteria group bacterium]